MHSGNIRYVVLWVITALMVLRILVSTLYANENVLRGFEYSKPSTFRA